MAALTVVATALLRADAHSVAPDPTPRGQLTSVTVRHVARSKSAAPDTAEARARADAADRNIHTQEAPAAEVRSRATRACATIGVRPRGAKIISNRVTTGIV